MRPLLLTASSEVPQMEQIAGNFLVEYFCPPFSVSLVPSVSSRTRFLLQQHRD
jgi:hypothetical protein